MEITLGVNCSPPILTLPAPGKVNHFLHIIGQYPNGYHALQTLFQYIDYSDYLTFVYPDHNDIIINTPGLDFPPEENLISKAIVLLQEETGVYCGIEITLDKILPIGAGLGGGSSNAATTLIGLNYMWCLELPKTTLLRLASKLGADVPFFLAGHAAWGEGIGNKLTKADPPENWMLLLIPDCHASTKALFNDQNLTRNTPTLTIEALESKSMARLRNDFESLVRNKFPKVAESLDWLSAFGEAKLTGSGSCVFATFETKEAAQEVAAKMPDAFKGVVTRGLNRSPLHQDTQKKGF